MRTLAIPLLLCGLMTGIAHAAPDSQTTEARFARSLQAIQNSRIDIAMNEVDNLLRVNPNFKLAQLVKGDLLMAHAGAISSFGSAANAPRDKIKDLQDEARARLLRAQSQPVKLAPRYLWQLAANQKYALVVDTSRSTLYVYENVGGEPRYVSDYYVTIGKLGTEKVYEGDQRTPIGVYFVKANLPRKQLADMYGSGAYPLNYPNEWDRKNKRGGSGIWLHGTPSDTYSRPPRASNGCIVLANADLDKLAPYLQVGVTPVIIANKIDWRNEHDQSGRASLLQEVERWRRDWASLDTGAYLEHYARDFSSDGMDYAAWVKHKQAVNSRKSWVKVDIDDISIFTYPDRPDMAVVNFEQGYESDNLSNRMKKRQYWIRQNNRWRILYEGAA
ncbi:MAG: L,D-transpeptidase family protein [Nitrosomonadales bacterium]|nr:L,D-transpeptidase family protein [Nitrosomonadales bacterium]